MTDSPTCPNCGAERLGPFCQNCGQQKPERLVMRGFFSLVATRVFSLDRGFLRTMVGLFKAPGVVAREFVDGRRIWYANPLTYWVIAATLQLLALWTVQDAYLIYLEETMRYSMEAQGETGEDALELYGQLFQTEDPIPVLSRVMLGAVKSAYSYMGLAFGLLIAMTLTLFMRKARGGFTMGEQLVFAMYVVGHWAFVTALLLPLTMRISPILHGMIGTFGYIVIAAWASLDFHQEGIAGAAKTALSMLLAFVGYMLMLLLVMIAFIVFEAASVQRAPSPPDDTEEAHTWTSPGTHPWTEGAEPCLLTGLGSLAWAHLNVKPDRNFLGHV